MLPHCRSSPRERQLLGHRYVTTDSLGNFNITGDYTCDAGYPVYLYAEGGNPSAPTAYQNSVVVTGATISGTGPYTIKLTVTGPSLVYQGEVLTFAGSSGNVGTLPKWEPSDRPRRCQPDDDDIRHQRWFVDEQRCNADHRFAEFYREPVGDADQQAKQSCGGESGSSG